MAFIFAHPQCNTAAYRLLLSWTNNPPRGFPTRRQINRFEGLHGPDWAWWRGRSDSYDAFHYYNPATDEGEAPTRSEWHWRRLVVALQRQPADDTPIGYHAAWCAHFAVDTLSPAHQVGHHHNSDSIKDNWRDPFADDFPFWSPHNHHNRFEWAAWKAVWRNSPPPGTAPKILEVTKIEDQLKALAREVFAHGLFDSFVKRGWSPTIERTFCEQVWPLTIRTVAGLWWAAMIISYRP